MDLLNLPDVGQNWPAFFPFFPCFSSSPIQVNEKNRVSMLELVRKDFHLCYLERVDFRTSIVFKFGGMLWIVDSRGIFLPSDLALIHVH